MPRFRRLATGLLKLVVWVHAGRVDRLAAGMTPAPLVPTDAIRWAAPRYRLADDRIGLRLPESADAAVLEGYASRPDGPDGGWVPLAAGASLADCQAVVGDWLAGWRNQDSFHGPALIVTAADDRVLAGVVGLCRRGTWVVELSYGIAPDRRRRGYATRAVRLTARWLLRERHAREVELRIAAGNTASQCVALAAGFTPAGTVRSRVPATGESYDDLRLVLVRR